MYNDLVKKLKDLMELQKDSKLSIYTNDDLDLIFEVKNLNKLSAHYFLLALLDELINQDIINKKILLQMINEIL